MCMIWRIFSLWVLTYGKKLTYSDYPPQYEIRMQDPTNLRNTFWELYQRVRHIPVMSDGTLIHTVVVPWELPMMLARYRIERQSPSHECWQLSALTPENWIFHRLFSTVCILGAL